MKRKKTMSTNNNDNTTDDENMHTLKVLSLPLSKSDQKFHENKQVEMSMA